MVKISVCHVLNPNYFSFPLQTLNLACEGDLAATSVTPLIARVDWADLAD